MAATGSPVVSSKMHGRWVQLVIGIICMGLVANLQYAWTLFVVPMEAKNHWGGAAIQTAFSIFIVVETWLVPIEGWLVDKFGPRPVVAAGAVFAAAGWAIDAYATTLPELYVAAVIAGIGAGCIEATRPGQLSVISGLFSEGGVCGAAERVCRCVRSLVSRFIERTASPWWRSWSRSRSCWWGCSA